MVTVRFFIKGNILQVDSFDELPSVTASYDFGGRNYECYKQEMLDSSTHNCYLREKIPAMFESDCKIHKSDLEILNDWVPRRAYNDSFNLLATYGTIKGFL